MPKQPGPPRRAAPTNAQPSWRVARCTRRANLVADERLEPRGEFRLRDELPRTGDTREPVAARGLFVLDGELLQRGLQLGFLHLAQAARGFVALGVFDGAREHVAKLFYRERFLRGEKQRFENKFQLHLKRFQCWPHPTPTRWIRCQRDSGSARARLAGRGQVQCRRSLRTARLREFSCG